MEALWAMVCGGARSDRVQPSDRLPSAVDDLEWKAAFALILDAVAGRVRRLAAHKCHQRNLAEDAVDDLVSAAQLGIWGAAESPKPAAMPISEWVGKHVSRSIDSRADELAPRSKPHDVALARAITNPSSRLYVDSPYPGQTLAWRAEQYNAQLVAARLNELAEDAGRRGIPPDPERMLERKAVEQLVREGALVDAGGFAELLAGAPVQVTHFEDLPGGADGFADPGGEEAVEFRGPIRLDESAGRHPMSLESPEIDAGTADLLELVRKARDELRITDPTGAWILERQDEGRSPAWLQHELGMQPGKEGRECLEAYISETWRILTDFLHHLICRGPSDPLDDLVAGLCRLIETHLDRERLSGAELAQLAGCSKETLRTLLSRSKVPKVTTLLAVLAALDERLMLCHRGSYPVRWGAWVLPWGGSAVAGSLGRHRVTEVSTAEQLSAHVAWRISAPDRGRTLFRPPRPHLSLEALAQETGLDTETLAELRERSGAPQLRSIVKVLDCYGDRLVFAPRDLYDMWRRRPDPELDGLDHETDGRHPLLDEPLA